MKLNKNYKTLAGAYNAGIKNEFVPYDLRGGYDLLADVLKAKAYTKAMIDVAIANVYVGDGNHENGTYCEILVVLKQTDKGFEWDRVGIVEHDDEGDNVFFDGDKMVDLIPTANGDGCVLAAAPRKPTPARGNGVNFDAFKGTVSEKNKALHAELVSRGLKNSKADEYQVMKA